jgi:alkyl hydroperoxide reductase subunit AhpC
MKPCPPIQLGDTAPDFMANTTQGLISFHKWIGNGWCLFFSHPSDFTPVCTTELGKLAALQEEFAKYNVKVLATSIDSLENHFKWIDDINQTQKVSVNFPIIADESHQIAELYGMIHPAINPNATVRSAFIIDPAKKVRLELCYPPSTGRNFAEILRIVQSMQLSDAYPIATPADWQPGGECVIMPDVTDPEILRATFPKGWQELRPWLRTTPQPDLPSSP